MRVGDGLIDLVWFRFILDALLCVSLLGYFFLLRSFSSCFLRPTTSFACYLLLSTAVISGCPRRLSYQQINAPGFELHAIVAPLALLLSLPS